MATILEKTTAEVLEKPAVTGTAVDRRASDV
jgi:hypothetical protein